jgi:hypothetical protein
VNPHRELAVVTPDVQPFARLHKGPRGSCPCCGADGRQKQEIECRACFPARRMRSGFLRLRRCHLPGVHLHQRCPVCGCAWICEPKVADEEERADLDRVLETLEHVAKTGETTLTTALPPRAWLAVTGVLNVIRQAKGEALP